MISTADLGEFPVQIDLKPGVWISFATRLIPFLPEEITKKGHTERDLRMVVSFVVSIFPVTWGATRSYELRSFRNYMMETQ